MGGNRISALRFVVGFGLVSALADIVYEGARSIVGPYLGALGASAAAVGLITGVGEASALVLRLLSGRVADRAASPWRQTLVGYVMTGVCVPLMALAPSLSVAAVLYTGERVGKAVRTPARDIMLSHASAQVGRGKAFGLHELLDKTGAMSGPLLVAGAVALWHDYRWGFAVLALPAVLAVAQLGRLRAQAPDPLAWEPQAQVAEGKRLRLAGGLGATFWHYCAFVAVSMLGFATWGSLAYHVSAEHLVGAVWVPVMYAGGMATAALSAQVFGRLYDRVGLAGLLVMPGLATAIPWLSFSRGVGALTVGALLWGAVIGMHDATMRSALADLVPPGRRGAGYGTFTAVYGLAWMVGASVIGRLYEIGTTVAAVYAGAVQAVAFIVLLALVLRLRQPPGRISTTVSP